MILRKRVIFFLLLIILMMSGFIFYRSFYPKFSTVSITIEKNKEIDLKEAIIVNFSQPVNKDKYEKGIKTEPEQKVAFIWKNSNRKLFIVPKDKWKMETEYKLFMPEGRSLFFSKIKGQIFNLATISYPKIIDFYPISGAQDILLGVEDPISMSFDKSISNFSLKISLNPETEVVYRNSDSKDQLKVLPKNELKPGQKYEVKIFAKSEDESENDFKEIFKSDFETLPPTPENWEKDFALRLEQAKKYTRPKIFTGRYIDINLTSQIMSIFDQGKIVDAFIVSSGKRGMDTPKGQFTIHNKSPRVWSKRYGLWMPFWMAVASDGSFGIHELPEWPGGFKEGANHLGTPVSHGCIRLGVGPAKQVYDFTDIGTPVIIY